MCKDLVWLNVNENSRVLDVCGISHVLEGVIELNPHITKCPKSVRTLNAFGVCGISEIPEGVVKLNPRITKCPKSVRVLNAFGCCGIREGPELLN